MKQRAPRAGRHPARRVALQTLFEIDFNRADAKETWQRGSFRTGLTDEAVELAKMFGSEASPKFVNGVLATAVGGRKEPSA